mmetsp:Transcript_11804/g.50590  ORF Transcript_11804/g.50590 Transcript_11804/m.50590 type:complete len:349 (+) Transcript_11804:2371-3417(+)
MQNARHDAHHRVLRVLLDAHDVHRPSRRAVLRRVVHALERVTRRRVEVGKLGGRLQSQTLLLDVVRAVAELVKNVEVAFGVVHLNDPRALQQVRADRRAADGVFVVELDLDELPEAARVVVSHRLRVTERLEQWVGLQHFLLHRTSGAARVGALVDVPRAPAHVREIVHYLLRRLRLARAGLAGDQDALARVLSAHRLERRLGDGEDVRAQLAQRVASVLIHHVAVVQVRQTLERVHRDEDVPRVRVDLVQPVAVLQVVQHARLVQVVERHHVLAVRVLHQAQIRVLELRLARLGGHLDGLAGDGDHRPRDVRLRGVEHPHLHPGGDAVRLVLRHGAVQSRRRDRRVR